MGFLKSFVKDLASCVSTSAPSSSIQSTSRPKVEHKFYNDRYVSRFFKLTFPKFNDDLLIQILSILPVHEILVLQSFIPNDYIKKLRVTDITHDKLYIKYPLLYEITTDKDVEDDKNYKIRLQHLFARIIKFNRDNKDNIIPVIFDLSCSDEFPDQLLDEWLDNCTNFDIEFKFFARLTYHDCKKFETFKYANCISSLVIPKPRPLSDLTNMTFDYSNLTRLNKLVFEAYYSYNHFTITLPPNAFDTITFLSIHVPFEDDYLLKFKNLTHLGVRTNQEKRFRINQLPKTITSLSLSYFNSLVKKIQIDSSHDWPQELEVIELVDTCIFQSPFDQLQDYKLPPKLKSFSINGKPIPRIINQLPETLTNFTFVNSRYDIVELSPNQELTFPNGVQHIQLDEFYLKNTNIPVILPSKLSAFSSSGTSLPLTNCCLEKSKSTLKVFDISHYSNPLPLVFDYFEFESLTTIKFDHCRLKTLMTFFPPTSIQKVQILDNDIKSIDEFCPLFTNPTDFPYLTDISICFCEVTSISPNIKLPINLQSLTIADQDFKKFWFNSSFANHKSLVSLKLSHLSAIGIHDKDLSAKKAQKSSLRHIDFSVKKGTLPKRRWEADKLYDSLELYLGRKIVTRVYGRDAYEKIILEMTD